MFEMLEEKKEVGRKKDVERRLPETGRSVLRVRPLLSSLNKAEEVTVMTAVMMMSGIVPRHFV